MAVRSNVELTLRADRVRAALTDPMALGLDGLKREGLGWTALCPWHPERTPSLKLRLYDDGIGAKCFGCDRGGTALDVLAATHGLAHDLSGAIFFRVLELAESLVGIDPGSSTGSSPIVPLRAFKAPRVPPPWRELYALWSASGMVWDDAEAVAWIEGRGLDPARTDDRGLARLIPTGTDCPRWAWGPDGSWSKSGHRLLVRTFDPSGAFVSMQARLIGPGDRKSLWPAGFASTGIFADELGQQLLATGTAPDWWRKRVVIIAEGIPDWLTAATVYGDLADPPAVFGIAAGTWTQAHADRVPDGCVVKAWTHHDNAGEKYLQEILRSFEDRDALEVEVVGGDNE